MALSFFISLFVTYTDIANRQTTNIFFGFLGSHSSDAREKKRKKHFLHTARLLGAIYTITSATNPQTIQEYSAERIRRASSAS